MLVLVDPDLSGQVIDIMAVAAALADPDFLVFIHFEVNLYDVHFLAAGNRLQPLEIRILDKVFALDLERSGLT